MVIGMIITDNSFGCVAHTNHDGVEVPGIVRNREHYTLMSELRRRERQAGRDGLAPVPLDRRLRGERRGGLR